MRIFIFILAVTVFGVWVEEIFSGVGAFVPAFVLLLQYGRVQSAFWASILWIFLQEGAGSLAFGGMTLFLAGIWVVFYMGNSFFERDNVFFMFSILFWGVIWRGVVVSTMIGLQDISAHSSFKSTEVVLLQLIIYFLLFIVYTQGFKRFVLAK